jgi:hypothetical protein|nr:MAG TPA: hypothetical protein [Caudoviricetes sp.]
MKSSEERIKDVLDYINDKITRSFKADYGLSDVRSDRLFTETVIELQIIADMLGGNENEQGTDTTNK